MPIEDKNLTQGQQRDKSWNKSAASYWEYKKGERAKLPDSFEDFYQEHKAEWKNALDIGCGTGRYLVPMTQDGLEVIGVEPSDGMRQAAEKNLEKADLKGKAQLVKGESKSLDFADESFDLIFSKGAIHHNTLDDIRKSFKEAARVLRKGQFFIFQGRSDKDLGSPRRKIPDQSSSGYTAVDLEGNKKDVIQHYFTKEELERLAVENGFEIVVGPEEKIRVNTSDSKKQNARLWVVYRKI